MKEKKLQILKKKLKKKLFKINLKLINPKKKQIKKWKELDNLNKKQSSNNLIQISSMLMINRFLNYNN